MGMEASSLVGELEGIRQSLHMNHEQFSEHLGVNHSTWSLFRRGLLKRAAEFKLRVVSKYPHLASYLTVDGKEPAHARS